MSTTAPARPSGLPQHWLPVTIVTCVVFALFTGFMAIGGLAIAGLWFAGFVPFIYGIVQLAMRRRVGLGLGLMGSGFTAGLIGLIGVGLTAPPATPLPPATPSPAPVSSTPATAAPTPTPTPSPTRTEQPDPTTAQEAVAVLLIKGRGPDTGYDRDRFGWNSLDFDRNGCDQRNDVLRRDLTAPVIKEGSNGCRVESGWLQDRYGETAHLLTRDQIDIDHVVSLSNAWQTGASSWDDEKLIMFANDPLNLVATTPHLNRQKGGGDAATWLPPAKSSRCSYVARQATVKWTYGLAATTAERDAFDQILASCPGQRLADAVAAPPAMQVSVSPTPTPKPTPTTPKPKPAVTPTNQPVPKKVAPTSPAPKVTPRPKKPASPKSSAPAPKRKIAEPPKKPAPPAGGDTDPQFSSCKKAIANGYGPYVEGEDPEYDWYDDRDDDGVVCEK